MKKLLSLAVLSLGMITVANAEEYAPEKGDFAVELGFTPFNTADGSSFKLNEGMLKVRYFLSSKDALRLKIDVGFDNDKKTYTNNFHPADTKNSQYYDQTTETKNKHTNFSFMVGYERHLFTKGRFDVYAGLELGYMIDKYSGSVVYDYTEKSFDNDNKVNYSTTTQRDIDYINQSTDGVYKSQNSFNANLFAGVDFYVWKNLYLGAELGLNFKTGKSPNYYQTGNERMSTTQYLTGFYYENGYQTYSYTTTTTTNTTYGEDMNVTERTVSSTERGYTPGAPTYTYTGKPSNEASNTSIKLLVEPAIRIGWRF